MYIISAILVSVFGGWPTEEHTTFEAIGLVKFNRRYFKRVHLYARSRIVRARVVSRLYGKYRSSLCTIYTMADFQTWWLFRGEKFPSSKKHPRRISVIFNNDIVRLLASLVSYLVRNLTSKKRGEAALFID